MADLKISERGAAATLTGAEVIGLIQSGGDVKSTLNDVADFVGIQPKVYKAYIGQSGSSDPLAVVVANTLGGVPALARSSTGVYILGLTGAFPLGRTFIPKLISFYPGTGSDFCQVIVTQISADGFYIRTYLSPNGSSTLSDGVLTAVSYDIEIYVYP